MKRKYLFVYLISLIGLGLSSRKFGNYLPSFVAEYSGDVIWAWMVFVGFCWLFSSKKMITNNLIFALIFSYSIEFSQLYQADWIVALRSNVIGKLVLGQGFLWTDFICYTLGIGIGYLIQLTLWKKLTKNNIAKSSK